MNKAEYNKLVKSARVEAGKLFIPVSNPRRVAEDVAKYLNVGYEIREQGAGRYGLFTNNFKAFIFEPIPKRASKLKSTSLPAGLSVKKVKGGWEVIHTASGNRLMPFAYPKKQLATDFAIRAGQVADWTRPFKDLRAESERLADLIRSGKKPGMFEKVLDMPTTFPKAVDDIQEMDKGQLIQEILRFSPDAKEYPDQAKSLSALHTYELRAVLRDLRESDVAKLQAIHDARSTRSKSADESRSNALTVDPDDPRVEQWIKDQGRMDVRGIDTPRKKPRKAKASAIRKRTYRGKVPTQVRGLRRG